jgi:hypothetical protein
LAGNQNMVQAMDLLSQGQDSLKWMISPHK